ncbi:hypothetical protein KM043_012514 [Ampulex compressa]|nr:hypothetical protein KM043_012514 [Ampulex compressa]
MLCGTFKKKRRHPGDEYRLVRSCTMPRILAGRDSSLVSVRRTKSSRVAARTFLIKDLLHMRILGGFRRVLYLETAPRAQSRAHRVESTGDLLDR